MFVLYDMEADDWTIYNESLARSRVSPDSTYKIFDALFALEEGVITPEHNFLPQPDESYPFEEWNQDQTLQSAMNLLRQLVFSESGSSDGRIRPAFLPASDRLWK